MSYYVFSIYKKGFDIKGLNTVISKITQSGSLRAVDDEFKYHGLDYIQEQIKGIKSFNCEWTIDENIASTGIRISMTRDNSSHFSEGHIIVSFFDNLFSGSYFGENFDQKKKTDRINLIESTCLDLNAFFGGGSICFEEFFDIDPVSFGQFLKGEKFNVFSTFNYFSNDLCKLLAFDFKKIERLVFRINYLSKYGVFFWPEPLLSCIPHKQPPFQDSHQKLLDLLNCKPNDYY